MNHTLIKLSDVEGKELLQAMVEKFKKAEANLDKLGCKSYEGVIRVSPTVVMGIRDGKD